MAVGPRHARMRSRRTWPQRLVLTTGVLLTFVCLAGASAVGYVYWKLGRLVHFDDLVFDEPPPPGAPENYLLVGSDSRENIDPSDPDYDAFLGADDPVAGGKRSDTIIIARGDPGAESIDLLSLPRDLWVTIASTGEESRINTAYGEGRQVLVDTIRENFGIEIHHYIEVDFRGFQGLVDAVDGVPMYFETAMRDRNSGLDISEPGCVVLDGDMALKFVRARHLQYRDEDGDWRSDPSADLGRITRQQLFIEAAVDQVRQTDVTDPLQLSRLLDVFVENVGVDAGLDTGDLLALARQFSDFSGDQMTTHALPVENFRTTAGAAVLRLDEAEAQPTFNLFRGLPPDAVTEGNVEVSVLNGTGVSGQAGDATDALEAVGFMTGSPSDADEPPGQTTIRYAPGSEFAADLLSRHLTSGAVLEEDESLGANQLVLITGFDFTTVMMRPRAESPSTTTTTVDQTTTTDGSGSDEGDEGDEVDQTTTTTLTGVTPGEPPPGVECG